MRRKTTLWCQWSHQHRGWLEPSSACALESFYLGVFCFFGCFFKKGETFKKKAAAFAPALWMIMGWFSFDSIKLSDFSRGGFHCFGMCLMRINLFRPRQGLPTHSAAFSFLPVEYVEMLPFVSTTCLVIRGLNDENLLRWKTALLGIIFCLCAARA